MRRFVDIGKVCQVLLVERVLVWTMLIVPRFTISKLFDPRVIGMPLTLSAFPLTPTNVPLLVYNFWDADNETDRREYGAPRTSNRASEDGTVSARF